MRTPAVAWPYSLLKRCKAYCLVQGQDQAQPIVIAAGGRFESVVRTGVGEYDVNLNIDMQSDRHSVLCSSMPIDSGGPATNVPTIVNYWVDVDNVDAIHIATFAPIPGPGFELFDLVIWTCWIMEPLLSEILNPWSPPIPPVVGP